MTYKIYKTPARYNIHGVDTYSILKKAKTPVKYCTESWERAIDKVFYNLEDVEKALGEIKKQKDKVIYEVK